MTNRAGIPQHIACALASLLLMGAARADRVAAPALAAHTQECGSCHMAYPPGLLPAASWRRLLDNLSHHYGTDASVDTKTLATLQPWFDAHAGTFKKVARQAAPPPQDRITRSAWFQREHQGIPTPVWQRASIKSPANCSACHLGAAAGQFSEHQVRVPS